MAINHSGEMSRVRKRLDRVQSGAWVPLYAHLAQMRVSSYCMQTHAACQLVPCANLHSVQRAGSYSMQTCTASKIISHANSCSLLQHATFPLVALSARTGRREHRLGKRTRGRESLLIESETNQKFRHTRRVESRVFLLPRCPAVANKHPACSELTIPDSGSTPTRYHCTPMGAIPQTMEVASQTTEPIYLPL